MQILAAETLRLRADLMVDRLLSGDPGAIALAKSQTARLTHGDAPDIFHAQIAKRLRGADPAKTPLLGWLQTRLQGGDSSVGSIVMTAQHRQGATNITMRNLVTSLRLMSEVDWGGLLSNGQPDRCPPARRVSLCRDGFFNPQRSRHRH